MATILKVISDGATTEIPVSNIFFHALVNLWDYVKDQSRTNLTIRADIDINTLGDEKQFEEINFPTQTIPEWNNDTDIWDYIYDLTSGQGDYGTENDETYETFKDDSDNKRYIVILNIGEEGEPDILVYAFDDLEVLRAIQTLYSWLGFYPSDAIVYVSDNGTQVLTP